MATSDDRRNEIIQQFQRHEGDTGSTEVQVALMTNRINYLTEHFKTHKQDFHSRRGLLKLVGHRRRMLKHLKAKEPSRYDALTTALGLRK